MQSHRVVGALVEVFHDLRIHPGIQRCAGHDLLEQGRVDAARARKRGQDATPAGEVLERLLAREVEALTERRIERRIKEEEKQRPGWSGRSYYFGSGRRYDGGDYSLRTSSGSITSGTTKSGFFSRFTSSIRSFGS